MERMDRATYWCLMAFAASVSAACWSFFSVSPPIGIAVTLFCIPRLLHDIGWSGWWSVGLFIAGVHSQSLFLTGPEVFPGSDLSAIVLAVMLVGTIIVLGGLPGQPGTNRFGAPLR